MKGADVCVVGGGLAGLIAAHALVESGARVVMLDRGDHDGPPPAPPPRSPMLPGAPLWYHPNRYRRFGIGGTWHRAAAGYAVRLHDADFELRRRYGLARDWPFPAGALARSYWRAERLFGVDGVEHGLFPRGPLALRVNEASTRLGAPLVVPKLAVCLADSRRALPLAASILPWLLSRPDFVLHGDARAIRLRGQADRVSTVDFISDSATPTAVEADVFVLAAHTVETIRLLRRSRPYAEETPVGRAFMEHPQQTVHALLAESLEAAGPDDMSPLVAGRVDRYSLPDGVSYAPRFVVEVIGHLPDEDRRERIHRLVHERIPRRSEDWNRLYFRLVSVHEQLPDEEHIVCTDTAGDSVAAHVHMRVTPELAQGLETAREFMLDLLREMGATPLTPRGESGFSGHQMGGLRMGGDPQSSVLDANLRVHGVDNLFCVGSAAFPTGGVANPSLTIAALALRLAEHLAARS